jgi:hypothetical protein
MTLREECSLVVLENMALMNIFQPKKLEVREVGAKLHEDMIRTFHLILSC